MSERLRIENLYKVFGKYPSDALRMLRDGGTKDFVFAKLGQVVGLNDVSLTVPGGVMYMVMGLSGSGKSTLARCINRLNEPSAGRVLLDGEAVLALDEKALREVRRTRMSMVFQHFALLPNKRVIDNVEFGLKLRGIPPAQRRRRAEELLSLVGLGRWGHHMPHELSGGMRQRVGLARALATDADILIMDEPFSGLDPLIRTEMQDELLRLQRTFNKTILFITHDFQEALKLGSRIAIMSEGRIVREGTPQSIVLEPGSDYVAAFTREIDRGRLFDARSVMKAPAVLWRGPAGTVVGGDGGGFLLDACERVVAGLAGREISLLRETGELSARRGSYVCVPEAAKLVEVARSYRADHTVGVIDDAGRLVGVIGAEQILARIAHLPASGAKS
ncbi:quaternary amine ABC transporter ATP-binding protein [Aquabacter spiritensis]|uniref:Trimethylamine N-oxide transport system ATP-binding protein TmoW n=1 Tax=Aquabacter spiritensis TaxID=933073 RepID=A0A4R3LW13_9HYPH|nr:glycine betaine/L-proline ABC transporter ATP-binding protein [Aquabacter spiritensis]TCT04782.1 glycine betaine/proline transport system ATP-binding protein [Aquabacter spiritensis]